MTASCNQNAKFIFQNSKIVNVMCLIPLFVTRFFDHLAFSKPKNVLPLVAIFCQENDQVVCKMLFTTIGGRGVFSSQFSVSVFSHSRKLSGSVTVFPNSQLPSPNICKFTIYTLILPKQTQTPSERYRKTSRTSQSVSKAIIRKRNNR